MNLSRAIPVSLGVTAILSIFMLQMGSDDETSIFLPIFALLAIPTGLWFCDIRKKFALSEGWANALILLAVLLHFGTLFQSASAFLAYSIANILVWVQLILFFRRKEIMTCYHLLILSFIEGGVACVFQQNPLFAPILLAFLLSVLCSISLLFLNQERLYYRTHAFLKPAFGAGEKVQRQTVGHLIALAVKTVFIVPLMVLWGYRSKEFFGEDDGAEALVIHDHAEVPAPRSASGEERLAPFFGVWQRGALERSAPTDGMSGRWPLFQTPPLFSGALRVGENDPVRRSLLTRLLIGAFGAILVSGVVFLVIPRFGDMEFGSVQFGHDRWQGAAPSVRSVTGFSETMKLGEMGPSINNYETVMRVRFENREWSDGPAIRVGEPVYFRGTTLVHYAQGEWSGPDPASVVWRTFSYRPAQRRPREYGERNEFPEKRPGFLFPRYEAKYERARFDPHSSVLWEEITLSPLSSQVLFTVWPFFQVETGFGMMQGERYLRSSNERVRESSYTLLTTAFRDGVQSDLIPAQESLSNAQLAPYRKIDRDLLPTLCAKAEAWDRESGLPKEDLIGRAKYLEGKLRDPETFRYSREGVARASGIDPLEDFIANHPAGHCEYFAGVLAMMLRAVAIPSRVVSGFCVVQEDPDSAQMNVRQADAHVWVEAYIPKTQLPAEYRPRGAGVRKPGEKIDAAAIRDFWWSDGGWLRLDATPERNPELFQSFNIGWQSLRETMTHFWNEYVLNFSGGRQREAVYQPIASAATALWDGAAALFRRLNPFSSSDGGGDAGTLGDAGGSGGRFDGVRGMAAALCALITCYGVFRLVRRLRRGTDHSERGRASGREAATGFFYRLERWLTAAGLARTPSETPREYVCRAIDSPSVAPLREADSPIPFPLFVTSARSIVEVYYRVRFGQGSLQPEEKERIDEFLRKLPRRGGR